MAATAGDSANLSTTGFAAGTYVVYAIDVAGNVSTTSAAITLNAQTADITAPLLSGVTTSSAIIGTNVAATSNEAGYLYLVPQATVTTPGAIDAAGVTTNGIKVAATAGDSANLSTTGFAAGTYVVYAIDVAGNVSTTSAAITLNAAISIDGLGSYPSATTTGSAVVVYVSVLTSYVTDATTVTAELVNASSASFSPSVTTSSAIYSNEASLSLNVPAGLVAGNYSIRVTIGNTIDSLAFVISATTSDAIFIGVTGSVTTGAAVTLNYVPSGYTAWFAPSAEQTFSTLVENSTHTKYYPVDGIPKIYAPQLQGDYNLYLVKDADNSIQQGTKILHVIQ